MKYTDYYALYDKAIMIAAKYHKGQTRMTGEDYFESHLCEVANSCRAYGYETATVAILHDILEDTDCTASDLLKNGIPADIVSDVILLTHNRDEPREIYYERLKKSKRALAVKIADIAHNLSTIPALPDESVQQRLYKKYIKALKCLTQIEE
jgi:(p)ppGpp synthase/HD superfamily hydrolase